MKLNLEKQWLSMKQNWFFEKIEEAKISAVILRN